MSTATRYNGGKFIDNAMKKLENRNKPINRRSVNIKVKDDAIPLHDQIKWKSLETRDDAEVIESTIDKITFKHDELELVSKYTDILKRKHINRIWIQAIFDVAENDTTNIFSKIYNALLLKRSSLINARTLGDMAEVVRYTRERVKKEKTA